MISINDTRYMLGYPAHKHEYACETTQCTSVYLVFYCRACGERLTIHRGAYNACVAGNLTPQRNHLSRTRI